MKIPEYKNIHGVNASNLWMGKAGRVEKTHEDQFEKQLEDSVRKRKSELKKRRKTFLVKDDELDEIRYLMEANQLFSEYEQKVEEGTNIDSDEKKPNSGDHFSSWV